MAYVEVKQALRVSGGERIAAVASQVSDLLGQMAMARLAEARRLASDPAVQRTVTARQQGVADDVPEVLRSFASRNPSTTIWISSGLGRSLVPLLQGAEPAKARSTSEMAAVAPGIGPLRSDQGRVWYATTVALPSSAGQTAASSVLTIQRTLGSTQAAALIERLIGSGATLKLGNAAGDTWTDLGAAVAAPPVSTPGTPKTYVDAGGEARIGVARPVAGTPWLLWVEVSEQSVLGPAADLLRRMLPITIALSALGALSVYFLSGRIAKPLEQLADAAESIAAGDYTRRVAVRGANEVGRLSAAFNTMATQVAESHAQMEARVQARTQELASANRELESFSYSVSHDLRAPLRSIDGFSQALLEDYEAHLDHTGRAYLSRIRAAAQRMGTLIDDLLSLSRVTRGELTRTQVNLTVLAAEVAQRLQEHDPGRRVEWRLQPDMIVEGDARWLQVAIENLLGNAWKFTDKRNAAVIEFGTATPADGQRAFFIRDNGAGFDMAYADKLFGAFQRLHGTSEFPGSGVGLATVHRIVRRHGGRIWAEAAPDKGATFFFTLEAQ